MDNDTLTPDEWEFIACERARCWVEGRSEIVAQLDSLELWQLKVLARIATAIGAIPELRTLFEA